jgi:hypothetical protein
MPESGKKGLGSPRQTWKTKAPGQRQGLAVLRDRCGPLNQANEGIDMKKLIILGVAALGASAFFGMSCSSDSNKGAAAADTGGQGNAGSSTSGGTAGSSTAGKSSGGSANGGQAGAGGSGGSTDPANAVQLPGDYYSNGSYHGYCYTYGDYQGSGTSTVTPPCGTAACFTTTTGMCIQGTTASQSGPNYSNWGVGIGCGMNQAESVDGGSTPNDPASLAGKTSINVTVYGNTMPKNTPSNFQIGVVVSNPPTLADGGTVNSTFCIGESLTAGTHVSIPLTSLTSACWNPGGPALDPATMTITGLQIQVNSVSGSTMPYDFCVSEFNIQ